MVSVVRILLLTIYSCLFYMKPPVKQYYSWMQCTTLRSDVPSMNWESKWGLLINNQWSKNLYIPQNPDIFTQLSLRLRVSLGVFFFVFFYRTLQVLTLGISELPCCSNSPLLFTTIFLGKKSSFPNCLSCLSFKEKN